MLQSGLRSLRKESGIYRKVDWRDFIDPEILANSDDEFTRYDSELPEGDILGLQTLQLGHEAANAINEASSFWPNNTIPYEFSKKQNALLTPKEMQIVLESMRIISHLSGNCVKFVERASEEDYISFQKGLQCMSNIGRIGGKQAVMYSPACLKQHGDVQHELMHVLGFFHEHSRSDRDEYVTIIWDNIAKSDKEQFAKHEDGNTYGLPYDYESVMHYKHNAFAKDSGIPTILPTNKKVPDWTEQRPESAGCRQNTPEVSVCYCRPKKLCR
ncbi:astacin-like metalloendopeptidase isoform X3 [Paramacrobiotus metropolitanus]|uniref:astacin-like metalloendopeptidase isoform X3 n=1 Tax=Paramacrobiotus metropolitanus TaxID=2943436 RepID=UPI00244622ED|nr:astacin-like metalloendopeptidase isoform X3 [Paramacrobiotus metropolitanus]